MCAKQTQIKRENTVVRNSSSIVNFSYKNHKPKKENIRSSNIVTRSDKISKMNSSNSTCKSKWAQIQHKKSIKKLVKYAHSKQLNENSNHIAHRAQSKKTKTIRSDETRNKNQHAELPLDLSNFELKLRSGRTSHETTESTRRVWVWVGDWRSKFFFFFFLSFFLFGFAKIPP